MDKKTFIKSIHQNGIMSDDPRITRIVKQLDEIPEDKINKEKFIESIKNDINVVEKSLGNNFIIPEF